MLIPPFVCLACLCSTRNSVVQKAGKNFSHLALLWYTVSNLFPENVVDDIFFC
jgi:hypothetical protein